MRVDYLPRHSNIRSFEGVYRREQRDREDPKEAGGATEVYRRAAKEDGRQRVRKDPVAHQEEVPRGLIEIPEGIRHHQVEPRQGSQIQMIVKE